MNFVHTKGMATLALLLTLPVAACENITDAEFGSVSIQLTDAAGDEVVEAWVTITDIYLQEASGDEDPVSDRVYLLEDASETQELLSLANDVADLVRGETVPTGTYGQLRIVISEGCLITADEAVFASDGYDMCGPAGGVLEMPSYEQSGVKVLLDEVQVTGGDYSLLLDFDVSQSFGRVTGNSGGWAMSPVIHGAETSLSATVDVTLSAAEVSLPSGVELGEFSATLVPATGDSSRVMFTDSDSDGLFEASFEFLMPDNGPFEVRLNAPADVTIDVDPATPETVDPASGETAVVDWVLQSVTVDEGDVECPWWVCGS